MYRNVLKQVFRRTLRPNTATTTLSNLPTTRHLPILTPPLSSSSSSRFSISSLSAQNPNPNIPHQSDSPNSSPSASSTLSEEDETRSHSSEYVEELLDASDSDVDEQIEPYMSGNLPDGFDPSTCRSVFIGNIHPEATQHFIQEVFTSAGLIEDCKLIQKEKSSYGFVDYLDPESAKLAISSLNGRSLFGEPIKVNWAFGEREDTSSHYNIFVGDLGPEITEAKLFKFFRVYPSCSNAKVMWDLKTGRSKGFGFVSFRNQEDAQSAINDKNGKGLGTRQIRCNWAKQGAIGNDDTQNSDSKNVLEVTNGTSEGGQDETNDYDPENNPLYRTVYVGNLAKEITPVDLHRHFYSLNAGVIEDVRIQTNKGFGFVRYSTHLEASQAIQLGNAEPLFGKPIKCSWGNKLTPPGTSATALPPPVDILLPPPVKEWGVPSDLFKET